MASYSDSRGSTALKTSVFQSETVFLISARNFAPLSRGSASTIFSCWAALKRYDSRSRRSFIKKKAKSGAHDSLQTFDQILVARNLPEFAMEGQVVLIKLIEVERLRPLLHLCGDAAQVFDVCGRDVLPRPLDGQRFQLRRRRNIFSTSRRSSLVTVVPL